MAVVVTGMASRGGTPWAAFGAMGGDLQPQIQAQVLMNLVDHGMDPAEAVARPRMAVLADGVTVAVEADYQGAGEMARSEANVLLMPPRHHSFRHPHAIVVDRPGAWRDGADPQPHATLAY